MRVGLLVLVTLCVPALASSLGAQMTLSGRVIDAETRRPVAGATVLPRRQNGERLRGSFADAAGRFELVLPPEEGIRVRIERVGYQPVELDPHSPESHPGVARVDGGVVVRLTPRPFRIEGLEARGSSRCETNPQEGAATYALWTEARTALRAALLTEEEELVRFRIAAWVRLLGRGDRVLETEEEGEWVVTRQPFDAVDPDELARSGYVHFDGDSLTYFGPDAAVLLSDPFADTHCFRVDRGGLFRNRGKVGLAFEPIRGRTLPDIRGTIWLDASTGQLEHVEYEYTAAGSAGARPATGRIEFLALPEGPWIVNRWHIRMPSGGVVRPEGGRAQPVRLREAGGEVREVLSTVRHSPG